MTITRTAFELINRDGDPIRGDVFAARNSKPDSAIVICHGFKGFKDWGSFPYVAEQLAERTGYPAIIFNFSGNGIGPDLLNFTELDKFEGNTFSKEIDDLEAILDSSEAGNLPGIGERYSFGLMGHSRGGISVIVTAAEDPRVDSVVTWNAVSRLDRWSDEHKEEWRSKGRVTVLNARTGQEMPLGLGLLEDYERNAERLDLLQAVSDLQQPPLLIHGASDESVRVSEGERLYAASGKDTTRFELIDGAGHTFGAVHPFAGTTEHLTSVIGLTADWFTETLNG
jgi:pimeloyl-ACP methyl ester carboxylesterase